MVDAEATIIITTGLAGTGAVGTATTITDNRFEVVSLSATASLGTATVDAEAIVTLTTSLLATAELGHVFKWQDIDESQTPNWTDVAA